MHLEGGSSMKRRILLTLAVAVAIAGAATTAAASADPSSNANCNGRRRLGLSPHLPNGSLILLGSLKKRRTATAVGPPSVLPFRYRPGM
jgi:hypothetical protein